eukprot:jgi/Mesvir1/26825/Mv24239-RA.1
MPRPAQECSDGQVEARAVHELQQGGRYCHGYEVQDQEAHRPSQQAPKLQGDGVRSAAPCGSPAPMGDEAEAVQVVYSEDGAREVRGRVPRKEDGSEEVL